MFLAKILLLIRSVPLTTTWFLHSTLDSRVPMSNLHFNSQNFYGKKLFATHLLDTFFCNTITITKAISHCTYSLFDINSLVHGQHAC